jgi:acyl-CoA synthetase (AMP-forming)/AMP-acid ligase II
VKSEPSPHNFRDFVERLSTRAHATPDALAYVYLTDGEDDQVSYTLGQLDHRARAIGQQLIASGMSGERALLLFPPGLDFVAALYGCFYAGVVAVPAYPPRRNRNMKRIQAIAEDANARLALSVQDHVSRVERFIEDTPVLAKLKWFAADCIDDDLANEWQRPEIDADTLAVLQYTSGSTGDPKGVMLTHSNIVNNCRLITTAFEANDNDVGMSWLPTYHDMGLVGGVLNPMFIPCPSILMSPTAFLQKPVRWLKAITKFGVTISGGPNFAYDVCTKKVTR